MNKSVISIVRTSLGLTGPVKLSSSVKLDNLTGPVSPNDVRTSLGLTGPVKLSSFTELDNLTGPVSPNDVRTIDITDLFIDPENQPMTYSVKKADGKYECDIIVYRQQCPIMD